MTMVIVIVVVVSVVVGESTEIVVVAVTLVFKIDLFVCVRVLVCLLSWLVGVFLGGGGGNLASRSVQSVSQR